MGLGHLYRERVEFGMGSDGVLQESEKPPA